MRGAVGADVAGPPAGAMRCSSATHEDDRPSTSKTPNLSKYPPLPLCAYNGRKI